MTTPLRVRRTRAVVPPPVVCRKGETVSITVTAEVTEGLIAEEDMELWLRHAVEHYHRFRAGRVGFGFLVGGIKVPDVKKH